MKILYYIGAVSAKGGVERILAQKANYFVDSLGWEVHVMTENQLGRALPYFFSTNVKFHDLATSKYAPKYQIKGISYWYMIKIVRKLAEKKIREISPDVVSVLDVGFSDFVVPYVCKDIPKVREFHFSREAAINFSKEMPFFKKAKYLAYRFMYYSQFGKYDSLVCLTDRDYKSFNAPRNGCVIPNFVEVPDELCKKTEINKRVLSVGSMHDDRKGFSTLIKIWRIVKNIYPDWTLHIYGDGSYRPVYQRMINDYSLQNYVFLEGVSGTIIEEFAASDLFAFASKGEGLPMVLLEAQSVGLPIVTYDTPCGPSDIVVNGENGYIVKMNDENDFVEKILLLIENDSLRNEMGYKAYENSLRFSEDIVMHMWVDLFSKLKN